MNPILSHTLARQSMQRTSGYIASPLRTMGQQFKSIAPVLKGQR